MEGFGMENFTVLHGHLVFLLLFWYILLQSGMFMTILVHFPQLFCTNKNLEPNANSPGPPLCC
jgi:hypothetical protein